MENNKTQMAVFIPRNSKLEENGQWKNRFEIRSESSNRVYIVAQNKSKGFFGCSCPGWRIHRSCKHLMALGLPTHEKPVTNVNIIER